MRDRNAVSILLYVGVHYPTLDLSPEPALTMVLSGDRRRHMSGFSGLYSSLLDHVSSLVILCLVPATILYSETQQSNDSCFVFCAHDLVYHIIVHNF